MTPPPPQRVDRQELEDTFIQVLGTTLRQLRRVADRSFAKLGLSSAMGTALTIIARQEGMAQKDLAKELGVEGPTVVRLVDQLCARQLVSREPTAADRRVRLLRATPKGHEMTRALAPLRSALQTQALADVSDTRLQDCLRVLLACQKAAESVGSEP